MECLSRPENLGAANAENSTWSCYNVGDVRKEATVDDEYASGVSRIRFGKAAMLVVILGFFGVTMGC